MSEPRKLYRSRTDQQISGVCGGLAQYLGVEAIWLRLAFVLLTIINGAGLLLYILLAIVIPKEPLEAGEPPQAGNLEETLREGAQNLQVRAKEVGERMKEGRGPQLLGWVLVALGGWFLLKQMGWLRIDEEVIFPLILIGIGALVLFRGGGR